ncbi:mitochondrial carrier protein MTM1-like isoform X6 [Cynara cardunculus var. scolymus]|uniref:mitochondrial carrier protein MTM1-like isoform X6 n=1 Tax=Cynara cardunculus var. scolymus TaxID=59895 RepID=UPI000D62300E|nr:mitochondrial carrier protein MTM1-like isoform X6 [Cynara cardunculus var. scolymus]
MVSSSSRQGLRLSASMSADASSSGVDLHGKVSTDTFNQVSDYSMVSPSSNFNLGFSERAFSAAGAAFLSAIIVNPLDVAKTRLQAQAAGVAYQNLSHTCSFETNTMLPDRRCFPSCHRSVLGKPSCAPDSSQYKGTLDVFNKIIRQEGFGRLWRGTSASLALSVPTVGIYLPCSVARSLACITCYPVELARTRMQAFKDTLHAKKPPGVWKTLVGVVSTNRSTNNLRSSLHSFRFLWTGLGAQLARDVPFSAICWATLEPVRRQLLAMSGDGTNPVTVLGANFFAGFVAGSLAGASTCPLDVAKTRHQIEKDQVRALKMTTRQTLVEIWSRDGGTKGLFMGVGARVGRAGPSVAIVVSFYEFVKYVLHTQKLTNTQTSTTGGGRC